MIKMKSSKVINKEKSKDKLEKIKSKYILQLVLDNLTKRKLLEVIKYNKKLQKRKNITINDYKDYLLIYSPIEVEIIPAKNKYGKFININNGDEIYFHIYFNNNKKEIKRDYLKENEHIKKIKVIIDYQIMSFEDLFENCKCIESIYFKKFKRNNIINMCGMFYKCLSLQKLNLSNFNTSNVTNMESMFSGCIALQKLNLSRFNTNNVTDMSGMFYWCLSLIELNLSNFNTVNVTSMSYMFYNCISLKELDLSNFNTNKVIQINYMFYQCSAELVNKIKDQYKNINKNAFL